MARCIRERVPRGPGRHAHRWSARRDRGVAAGDRRPAVVALAVARRGSRSPRRCAGLGSSSHWGWRWFGPTPPTPRRSPPPAADRWARTIAAAPLRRAPAAPVAPRRRARRRCSPAMRGCSACSPRRDGDGYALFRLAERGAGARARPGSEIARDVTLDAVRPDGVRIRDRGRGARHRAAADACAALRRGRSRRDRRGARRAACAPPPGFKGPVVPAQRRAARPAWRRSRRAGAALLAPVAGGLVVRDESGFAAMLGMKAGDRVAQANGIALAAIDDVLVGGGQAAGRRASRCASPGRATASRREWLFLNAGACPAERAQP